MPQFVEKPILIVLHAVIKPESKNAFVDWQAQMNASLTALQDFVSLEFLSPTPQYPEWLITQRFSDAQAAASWRTSEKYQSLLKSLKEISESNGVKEELNEESSYQTGVTEIFITQVEPGQEENFRTWSAKIHEEEAKFLGFRGTYIQSPINAKDRFWLTLLQFDTKENLDKWLESTERKKLLEKSTSISSLEQKRIVSPYAGWFASIAKVRGLPPVWKQTMLILLVLFPIVMVELKYLSPLTAPLNRSLATFISNAISVSLISFPMMPIAIYLLGWWLSPDFRRARLLTFLGTIIVLALYLIEIIFFWNFLG